MNFATSVGFLPLLATLAILHPVFAAEPALKGPADLQKIQQALPAKAFAQPKKPRRLLIFDLNVNYGGHGSIPYADTAFTLMGQRTGAFQTVVSRDPEVFRLESLREFDAVFFNNNVGDLFTDPQLRQNLIDFVYSGGGLMAVHGTTVAFTKWPGAIEDWPEFGMMLGGRGANHKMSDERVIIKLDDPANPINQAFAGKPFEYRDEFFRVHGPYSRGRVRVLFSIDTVKTDMTQKPSYGAVTRPDNDYALAWIRNYGRGRVFYCTIAHNPSVFYDPQMLSFYLAAAQFALGDLPAPTTPSARLTPAVVAQERLGWRPGFAATTSTQSLFDSIDVAARQGLCYLGALAAQPVSSENPHPFAAGLSDDVLRQVRLKLDSAGVRLLTYSASRLPDGESDCRRLFAFVRRMGMETIIADAAPESLDLMEKLCREFDLTLAVNAADPKAAVALRQAGGSHIGLCIDVGLWQKAGLDLPAAAAELRNRLFVIQCGGAAPKPQSVRRLLIELSRLKLNPIMLNLGSPTPEP